MPAEPVMHRTAVRGGHVPGEPLPRLRAVLPGRQRFKQHQMPGHAQDLRGAQLPGSAQRGQALGLDGEQVTGRTMRVLPTMRLPSA